MRRTVNLFCILMCALMLAKPDIGIADADCPPGAYDRRDVEVVNYVVLEANAVLNRMLVLASQSAVMAGECDDRVVLEDQYQSLLRILEEQVERRRRLNASVRTQRYLDRILKDLLLGVRGTRLLPSQYGTPEECVRLSASAGATAISVVAAASNKLFSCALFGQMNTRQSLLRGRRD
ncbi:hypothetical protein K2D_27740 [Planctomycetes bacterium K2D]|uniref:Uncharacterized protein n=1 Tax=Botrimarina mediterranea TaxID=2528022 RepID=A0A518K9R4_9BACT|nr:hypothetical protein Spa11_27270 [Botrimarina mediterranea]QDV79163.1 hypothetical protein K2D_27740 [Planctomycetes bacterium K2D]